MQHDSAKVVFSILILVVAAVFLGGLFLNGSGLAQAETVDVIVSVAAFQCSDGIDNDFDGLTDFPNDPGCVDGADDDETNPQCNDSLDNDLDGLIDFPADPDCTDLNDDSEASTGSGGFQCSDGIDNDLDGFTDYPDDPGCQSAFDISETGEDPGGDEDDEDDEDEPTPLPDVALQVVFTGLSHPRGDVYLLVDGNERTTTVADDQGEFEMTIFDVTPGTYLFTLYGLDEQDVRSGLLSFAAEIVPSPLVEISRIFIPPTLDLIVESVPVGERAVLSGRTIPGSTVSFDLNTNDGKREIQAQANSSGFYSYSLQASALTAGQYIVKTLADVGIDASPFGRAIKFFVGERGDIFLEEIVPGDFNRDGSVNLVDFSMIAYWYNRTSPPTRFDLDEDGFVTLSDFSIMAFYWTG